MIRKALYRLFDRFSILHTATLTLAVFVIFSLLGGIAIYGSESQRIVHGKEPIFAEVTIVPNSSAEIQAPPRKERHTFVQDTTYQGEKFVDALFMAVSALSVTGLTTTDFSQFTLMGQIIVLLLIQIGGLGIILFSSIFFIAVVRGLSRRDSFKTILSGILDTPAQAVKVLIRQIVAYTIFFEILGFLLLGVYLSGFTDRTLIGDLNPWWWSFFHSISAFNNAGLSLMQNNLMNFDHDPFVPLVISGLIILGGLGYPVLIALHVLLLKWWGRYRPPQISDIVASPVQVKVVLTGTVFLLALGTLLPLLLDWQSQVLQSSSFSQKFLISFFQSVSSRTAGFNLIDVSFLSTATTMLYMILMFIGANPAGTSGGIKIPSVVLLYGYIKDWFEAPRQPVRLFHVNISRFSVSHAIRLLFSTLLFLMTIILLILIAENQYLMTPDPTINFHKVLFEIISAFGTVGLSLGFTGGVTSLSAIFTPFSKFLLMITMLFGRLGALTILAALFKWKAVKEIKSLDYPDAQRIQVG